MFLIFIADGKTAAKHGEKGRKTAETHPKSAFGWVLNGWVLGRSLRGFPDKNKTNQGRKEGQDYHPNKNLSRLKEILEAINSA